MIIYICTGRYINTIMHAVASINCNLLFSYSLGSIRFHSITRDLSVSYSSLRLNRSIFGLFPIPSWFRRVPSSSIGTFLFRSVPINSKRSTWLIVGIRRRLISVCPRAGAFLAYVFLYSHSCVTVRVDICRVLSSAKWNSPSERRFVSDGRLNGISFLLLLRRVLSQVWRVGNSDVVVRASDSRWRGRRFKSPPGTGDTFLSRCLLHLRPLSVMNKLSVEY